MEIAARNQVESHGDGYCTDGLIYELYQPFGKNELYFPKTVSQQISYEIAGTCLHTTDDYFAIEPNLSPWFAGIWERPQHLTCRLVAGEYGNMETSLVNNIWKFEIVVTCFNDGSLVTANYYKEGQFYRRETSNNSLALSVRDLTRLGGTLLQNGNLTVLRIYDRILNESEIAQNHLWNVKEGKV